MRDIRSDLQERATLISEQIGVAYDQFQKTLEQVQNERDAKIADLESQLAMVAKFIEFEQRYEERFLGNSSPPAPPSPLVTLADLFMHRLNEAGRMSRKELADLAVKEGFFPDAESAVQGVHPMLVNMLRSEAIREVENGIFAPPTTPQKIKVRRVV
jgi:hypothetical protein